jgi:acetyltransferase
MSLKALFEPESVVLIGSSKIRETGIMVTPEVFRRVETNLRDFKGKVAVVDIEENNAIPSCDLAIITLPPPKILGLLPSLKTKFAIILSSGFDAEQRNKMAEFSRFRVLGPNSVCGILNTKNSLNTTFEGEMKSKSGRISVISQSGGIGATILDYMVSRGVGFSKFAWVGDMADINECDLLEYFMDDRETKVILIYIESMREPRRFMEIASRSNKPIVVLKSGVSEESKERAFTHTDSLSTDAEIYSGAFRQSSIIEVENVRELFNCGLIFERYKKRKIRRIAIVSNTGGSSILAADMCHKLGLRLSKLSETTKNKITAKYPKIKTINPVDMAADADGERYKHVLEAVAKDANVDAILIINQLKSCLLKPEELEALKRLKTGKVVVDCAPGDDDFRKIRFFLTDTFPIYSSVDDAVKVLKKVSEFGNLE